MKYVGHVTVEDASGARFEVHEYRVRRPFRLVSRFILETGQRVNRINGDHYVVAETGETLCSLLD